MKNNFLLIFTSVILIACGYFFGGVSSASVSPSVEEVQSEALPASPKILMDVITREDEESATLYRNAAEIARRRPDEGEGCRSIPYLDLQRQCVPLMEKKRDACHPGGGNPICGGQLGQDLTRAINAENYAEIRRLLEECKRRQKGLQACAIARRNGSPVWHEARDRITQAKRTFSRKQGVATDAKVKQFWNLMVRYSDMILEYYTPAIRNHDVEWQTTEDHVTECNTNIRNAERALIGRR